MNCPACKDSVLSMSERQGVEIDYCPKCRGVWLDRGELDKILEKSIEAEEKEAQASAPAARPQQQAPSFPQQTQGYPQQDPAYYPNHHGKYKRRKSFLEELFD